MFITQSGTAIPIANELNIIGTGGITTSGSGNTVTINGSGFGATITGDSGGAISPTLGNWNLIGGTVVAGSSPVKVAGAGSTLTINVQRAAAIAATDSTKIGLASFNNTQFSVDANGFVSLAGGSLAIDSIGTQAGTNPIFPTAGGLVTINGAVVAAGTNPIRSDGIGPNTMAIEVQISQALAATDATKIGLSNFDSASFSVDANGFVTLRGGTEAIDSIGVDATSGGGTNPVLPTAGGLVTVNGALVAASTTPVRSVSTAANVYQIQVQTSQALAAADSTKVGLSNFDSASFAVAATGFVTLTTTGAGKTITGDSGGALSPTANNWNILGLSGSKTSGAASTLTIKSPPFSQVGSSATSTLNSGEFVTAAVTRTLPASAGLADGDLFIYCCTTASALTIQAVSAQKIRIGTLLSSAAGTVTSTAIGDSISLRFDATQGFFMCVSVVGTWVIA